MKLGRFSQEGIVLILAIALFVIFSVTMTGFATIDNVLSLLKRVSVLGLLGLGMAISVISRGVDLSLVSVMVVSLMWPMVIAQTGVPLSEAIWLGLVLAILAGALNGALIAYAEIPAIFTTLGTSLAIYGLGATFLFNLEIASVPAGNAWFEFLSNGYALGIPMPIIVLACVSLVVFLGLRMTVLGRYIYAMGDNPLAARITGVPVRPVTVIIYIVTAIIAFISGILIAADTLSVNTRLTNSTMIYDVLLVVVLGGIGMSGGHGNVRNVLVGTLLVGILLNGMTIMNAEYTTQNVVKSLILLLAIIIDTLINPRDEQTSQQGDI